MQRQHGDTSQKLDCQWRYCGSIGFHPIMAFIPQTAGVLLKGVRGLLPWKLRGKSKYVGSCVRFFSFLFFSFYLIFVIFCKYAS